MSVITVEGELMSTVLSAQAAFASLVVLHVIECQRERTIPFKGLAGSTMFIIYLFLMKFFPNHLRKVSCADTCIYNIIVID